MEKDTFSNQIHIFSITNDRCLHSFSYLCERKYLKVKFIFNEYTVMKSVVSGAQSVPFYLVRTTSFVTNLSSILKRININVISNKL